MRDKFQKFMMGRYGNDKLNQFLMILAIVCLVLSLFGLRAFYVVALAIMVYAYVRMLSKNIQKRYAENQKYLQYEWKIKRFFQGKKKEFEQRKDYRIYKCPNCRQKLRVPRGKGKIAIRCRKCGTEFIKKT